jgi:hypothetical protein
MTSLRADDVTKVPRGISEELWKVAQALGKSSLGTQLLNVFELFLLEKLPGTIVALQVQ